MSIPNPRRKRTRRRSPGIFLFTGLGAAMWIASAWIWVGQITPFTILGVVIVIVGIMRIAHPVPARRRP